MKKRLPPVVLFILAPVIGELLSGSAPPAEFLDPRIFLILMLLYGGGAVLARELVIRWRKGWPSLLVLGLAYGIIEEGLMAKSFFDPGWQDLGVLGTYGRWVGVNWVWSLELVIYHAVCSIAIPILLVHLLFPARRDEPWLGKAGWGFVTVCFVVDVAFGAGVLTTFQPGAPAYWITAGVAVALVLAAWRLPRDIFTLREGVRHTPFRFWLVGFAGWIVFFVLFYAFPGLVPLPPVVMALSVALAGIVLWRVMRLSGNGGSWRDTHRLALAMGPLGFYILLTPIREYVGVSTDNPAGMVAVGIIAAVLLLWLYITTARRVRREYDG